MQLGTSEFQPDLISFPNSKNDPGKIMSYNIRQGLEPEVPTNISPTFKRSTKIKELPDTFDKFLQIYELDK